MSYLPTKESSRMRHPGPATLPPIGTGVDPTITYPALRTVMAMVRPTPSEPQLFWMMMLEGSMVAKTLVMP